MVIYECNAGVWLMCGQWTTECVWHMLRPQKMENPNENNSIWAFTNGKSCNRKILEKKSTMTKIFDPRKHNTFNTVICYEFIFDMNKHFVFIEYTNMRIFEVKNEPEQLISKRGRLHETKHLNSRWLSVNKFWAAVAVSLKCKLETDPLQFVCSMSRWVSCTQRPNNISTEMAANTRRKSRKIEEGRESKS